MTELLRNFPLFREVGQSTKAGMVFNAIGCNVVAMRQRKGCCEILQIAIADMRKRFSAWSSCLSRTLCPSRFLFVVYKLMKIRLFCVLYGCGTGFGSSAEL